MIARLRLLEGSIWTSPQGVTARIERVGLHHEGGTVPYSDMTMDQLDEVVRNNEAAIRYADFEPADEVFKHEVVAKLDLSIWPKKPKKPQPLRKDMRHVEDTRRVVLEEIPDMPTEEPPF